MVTYYPKRAFEILREEGPVELSKQATRFILRQLNPQYSFRFFTYKNHLQNRVHYRAPPDPYTTIKICPSEIDYRVGYTHKKRTVKRTRYGGIAQTKSGNWDRNRVHITESFIIKGILEHFEENIEWEDTTYYSHIFNKYTNDNTSYENIGITNLDKYLEENFNSVEELFNNIRTEGYKPNHDGQHVRPSDTQPVRDRLEVLVTIDRDGEINFFEGSHRFGIARVLNIEIPAHVVCRHAKWQEFRDNVYQNGLPEDYKELRDHPDLQDIV